MESYKYDELVKDIIPRLDKLEPYGLLLIDVISRGEWRCDTCATMCFCQECEDEPRGVPCAAYQERKEDGDE